MRPGSGAHVQSVGTAAPAYTLARIWTALPSSSGSTASMFPVMTPAEFCWVATSTDVTVGDWLKKFCRTNATTAQRNGNWPGGATGAVPMNGLRIALTKPVTMVVTIANGVDGTAGTEGTSVGTVVRDEFLPEVWVNAGDVDGSGDAV